MTPDDAPGGYPAGGHHPERNGGLLPEDSESSTRSALPTDLAAVQADDALLDGLGVRDDWSTDPPSEAEQALLEDTFGCYGPAFSGHTGEMVLAALRRGLAAGIRLHASGPDTPVAQMLTAWRRDVESEPIPQLVDTDTALAVAARARRQGRLRRFWRWLCWP